MQTANVNLPITVTVRHEQVTDALRDHVHKKIEGLHLDYPRIIEAKAILDVQKNRFIAEIILYCANHITIEAHTEGKDMYAALDETIEKIARRMRKHKTRLMKKHRPHRNESIRHLEERYFGDEAESLGGCGRCDVCRDLDEGEKDDPEARERDALVVRKALAGVARAGESATIITGLAAWTFDEASTSFRELRIEVAIDPEDDVMKAGMIPGGRCAVLRVETGQSRESRSDMIFLLTV